LIIKLFGSPVKDEITVYPSIADFENDCYDLTEFEKSFDELDAKSLAVCIKDMYYNSIALCQSKYYRYKSFWADWNLYGYDHCCPVKNHRAQIDLDSRRFRPEQIC
jgi:hypothetical protein